MPVQSATGRGSVAAVYFLLVSLLTDCDGFIYQPKVIGLEAGDFEEFPHFLDVGDESKIFLLC